MAHSIETSNLTKHFQLKDKICEAVNEVNIRVDGGELLGLLGPNGAGKTTLIKLLCTLILPTRGSASICGRDIVRDAGIVRDSIGLIDGGERSLVENEARCPVCARDVGRCHPRADIEAFWHRLRACTYGWLYRHEGRNCGPRC